MLRRSLQMQTNASEEGVAHVAPSDLPDFLPSRPVFASHAGERCGIVVQRYRHPPARIEIPGLRDHLLVLHLTGPVLIEDDFDGERRRRWSESGQVSITPAAMAGSRTLKGRTDAVLIHISPALLSEVAEEVYGHEARGAALIPRLAVTDETLHRLGQALAVEVEAGGAGDRLLAELLGRAIALNLLRRHSNLAPAGYEAPKRIASGRLRRVIDHMHAHLEENLPLAELARLSGLSPSQFARGFRETTGRAPHRYLSDLRIERARDLLEHSEQSVTDIGLSCGFVQPSHFATIFRKRVGMTPRAWRVARRW
jgi:AraC family transcriptional regulator